MDVLLKELDKLEYLSRDAPPKPALKVKAPSITASLDALLETLQQAKQQVANGILPGPSLQKQVEARKKDIDDREKEVYNSLARIGKALDKKFPDPVPVYPPLFESPQASAALDCVVASHLIRSGAFSVAHTFIREAAASIDPHAMEQFEDMHRIINALRAQDLEPALDWCATNREFLASRTSPLEFHLHRSRYLYLLFSNPDAGRALAYGRKHFPALYTAHSEEIVRLTTAVLFLPPTRLASSPYADLANPTLHSMLESEFATEYCASLHMSRQPPLRAVGDIGGGGALARIEKGKRVMQEKKGEWSQLDELPVEIPVPPENRYHSIFACPVSKEQATEANPPMMLTCGHVLAKESLSKLIKNGSRVKCPYCPVESVSPALRVFL